jgi:predicted alpha/beta superfamily hydrolase
MCAIRFQSSRNYKRSFQASQQKIVPDQVRSDTTCNLYLNSFNMIPLFSPFISKTIWTVASVGLTLAVYAQNTGTISPVNKFTIHSEVLNEDRTVSIYKPPAIAEFPGSISPVIYLLDGELVSDLVRAQIGYFCEIWRELPPITVVGIENLPGKTTRNRDLIPSTYSSNGRGQGEAFLRFIREEVMPLAEKDYKQKPYRVLIGSSLAGFFTLHTFLHHSNLFDSYIASSPSLHVKNNALMQELTEKLNTTGNSAKVLFFGVGNEGARYVSNTTKLDSLLKKRQLPNLRHRFEYYPNETHGTTPMKSYYDAIRFIFRVGHEDLNMVLEEITYNVLEDYYSDRSTIFGIPMKPNEFIINNYGYRFLYEMNQPDKALEFFMVNIENYPQSANAYNSYAEGLLVKGDKHNSLLHYEKAFALNPGNKALEQRISKLKKELNK